jgi:hypothetical protein
MIGGRIMMTITYLLTSKWHDVDPELLPILGLIDIFLILVVAYPWAN